MVFFTTVQRLYEQYLTNTNYNLFLWPAQSFDLNPIENLSRMMKAKINARISLVHDMEAFKVAI